MCKFKDSAIDAFFTRESSFTGHERYLNETFYLFGSSCGDLKDFAPGTHTFEFSYQIPKSLPTSVKAKHGKIRYRMEANLQTGWEFDIFSKVSFSVIRFEDLSNRIDLMTPASDETIVTFCCLSCITKPLIIKASIPFVGYVPNEKIRVTIMIDNRCGFDVYRTKISLKKVFTYVSETPTKKVWDDSKTFLKTITEGAKNGRETKIFGIIDVPPCALPTNLVSNVVKVSYVLHISADVVGFIKSPKVKLPIVIGTKPLKFENKVLF